MLDAQNDFNNSPKADKAFVFIVSRNSGRVLMQQRSYDGCQWGVPGGYVDEDDRSSEAGAVRELQEETGLKLEESSLTALMPAYECERGRLCALYYAFVPDEFYPDTVCDESLAYLWTHLDQMPLHTLPFVREQLTILSERMKRGNYPATAAHPALTCSI